jgi:hypothetical protein
MRAILVDVAGNEFTMTPYAATNGAALSDAQLIRELEVAIAASVFWRARLQQLLEATTKDNASCVSPPHTDPSGHQ